MASYGFPDLKIELDDSGSTARDISAYVTSINGVNIEAILQEITAAGDGFERWVDTAFKRMDEVVLAGPHDDTALGLWALTRDATGSTRTLLITFGGSITVSVDCIIRTNNVGLAPKTKHEFQVALQPTGTITVA